MSNNTKTSMTVERETYKEIRNLDFENSVELCYLDREFKEFVAKNRGRDKPISFYNVDGTPTISEKLDFILKKFYEAYRKN